MVCDTILYRITTELRKDNIFVSLFDIITGKNFPGENTNCYEPAELLHKREFIKIAQGDTKLSGANFY